MIFIKDEEFIRGDCPMTKEDVRILSIAKLELEKHHNLLDIGAGTGSVAIQGGKICSEGQVIAIEKEEKSWVVLEQNKEKFAAENVTLIRGEALSLAPSIHQSFHRIFVGGSGGNIEELIKTYGEKLESKGRMVLNFITIDNLYKAMNTLKSLKYKVECTEVTVSKTRGQTYMLMANNPIFIVSAEKEN